MARDFSSSTSSPRSTGTGAGRGASALGAAGLSSLGSCFLGFSRRGLGSGLNSFLVSCLGSGSGFASALGAVFSPSSGPW